MKNSELKAFVFPGQGSQFKGMGKELFNEFKDMVAKADKILGYSIEELCLEDKDNKLDQTDYTQPALYIVNALSYLHELKENGQKPDYVAGHSLGEYNALFAAGAFDFETGLRLVMRRGELMAKAKNGGMMAAIGVTYDELSEALKEKNITTIDLANLNTKFQTIMSGKTEDLEEAQEKLKDIKKIRCIKLNTSGAFHSRYMEESRKEFSVLLDQCQFNELQIPVIANFTARPYKNSEIKNNLDKQLTGSVKWLESMRYLMGKGVSDIRQIGPGTVLTNMLVKIKKESEPLIVNDEEEESISEKKSENIKSEISAETLGSSDFKKKYGLKYAYIGEAMYNGISSAKMAASLANAGMLGLLGTQGRTKEEVSQDIDSVREQVKNSNCTIGINITNSPYNSKIQSSILDLCISKQVNLIEVSEYMSITKELVLYRLHGVKEIKDGKVTVPNHIIAKVSRIEIAELFACPPQQKLVDELLKEGSISDEEARAARKIPMADSITITCDSEGHIGTSAGFLLVPLVKQMIQKCTKEYGYDMEINVGTTGGIGEPKAAAAAFLSEADYIGTGSINQCTQEAAVSESVKEILESIDIHDTEYVPEENLFELGAKCQVVRKGLFFPARANKLYETYRYFDSIENLDAKLASQLEERYFGKTFNEIYDEVIKTASHEEIEQAEQNKKYKMLLIFKWYFNKSRMDAIKGNQSNKVNYLIKCSSAMGFFNNWSKGKPFEKRENRHVDQIGIAILEEAACFLNERFKSFRK